MEHRDIPYILYESQQARNERTIKRLILALIIAIVLIFVSNAVWLFVVSQYEIEMEETEIDVDAGSGTANYIGNDGDIHNGQDYNQDKKSNP